MEDFEEVESPGAGLTVEILRFAQDDNKGQDDNTGQGDNTGWHDNKSQFLVIH